MTDNDGYLHVISAVHIFIVLYSKSYLTAEPVVPVKTTVLSDELYASFGCGSTHNVLNIVYIY